MADAHIKLLMNMTAKPRTLRSAGWCALLLLAPSSAWADFTSHIQFYPSNSIASAPLPVVTTPRTDGAPFSEMELFEIGSRSFALFLSAPTGEVEIHELFASGTMSLRDRRNIGNEGWRSVQVWRQSGRTRAHFYGPRTGATLRYEISNSGLFVANSRVDNQFSQLKNKTIVSPYTRGGQRRAFTFDPFSGDVAIHTVAPQSIANTTSYTLGWSDFDHIEVGGSTYRLLYKEVGHPYRPASENAQAGRLRIVQVGSDGLGNGAVLDADIGAGWSQVGFSQHQGALAVYAYSRNNGSLMMFEFAGSAPGSSFVGIDAFTIERNFDRLTPVTIGSQSFLLGARFDPDVDRLLVLDGDKAAKLASCVQEKLSDHVMGYQLAVIQNGKYLINRASGLKQFSPSSVPLTSDDRLDHGSVGKMFTAVTAMKAADNGVVALDGSLAAQLVPNALYLSPWLQARTPRDLIAQTTGWDRNKNETFVCETVGSSLTTDCFAMMTNQPPVTCTGPNNLSTQRFDCPYAYYNANFGMLRKVLEYAYGVSTTPEIHDLTRQLWLDEALPNGPSCRQQSTVKRFRYCRTGVFCIVRDGHLFEQVDPGGDSNPSYWSKSCGAGGWRSSARDVAQFVEQLRSEQILSPSSTDELFSNWWFDGDGDRTGHGWETPYVARSSGARVVGKDGGTGYEKAFATNLEGNVSVSLVHNTGNEAPSAVGALKDAYRFALGELSSCTGNDVGAQVHVGSGGASSEAASIYLPSPSGFIVGLRNSSGNLQIKAYSHLTDGTLIQRSQYFGGTASEISLAAVNGGQFMVGFKNGDGDLEVQLFSVSASLLSITKQDEYTAGAVRSVKLVQMRTTGAEVAVVAKTGNSRLKVIVFDRSGSNLYRRDSYESSGSISGVDGAAEINSGQLVVAARISNGNARVIAFQVNSSGTTITRRVRSRYADEDPGKQVRVSFVQTDQGPRYVTAMINDDDNLEVRAWTVSAANQQLSLRGVEVSGSANSIGRNIVSGQDDLVFVGYHDGNGKVRIKPFTLSSGGSSILEGSTWQSTSDEDVAGINLAARPDYLYGSILQTYLIDGNYNFTTWRYRPRD